MIATSWPCRQRGDVRVLDDVRGRVRGRQGHRDQEVGGGEPEQHQHEQLALPEGQQPLEHRDRALAVRALLRHPPVDRQRPEQGQRDQHQGRERGQHAGGERGDARLVAEGGEVVDAGQAHHPPPRVALLVRSSWPARAEPGLFRGARGSMGPPPRAGHGVDQRDYRSGPRSAAPVRCSSPRRDHWTRSRPARTMPATARAAMATSPRAPAEPGRADDREARAGGSGRLGGTAPRWRDPAEARRNRRYRRGGRDVRSQAAAVGS